MSEPAVSSSSLDEQATSTTVVISASQTTKPEGACVRVPERDDGSPTRRRDVSGVWGSSPTDVTAGRRVGRGGTCGVLRERRGCG
jgi:hypothetical protein